MVAWIRWIDVDSSGSAKPDDSPIATTLRFHAFARWPDWKRSVRGSASGRPSRLRIRRAVASSSLMCALENTWPLPVRCCRPMRHCHPAGRAVAIVYGGSSAPSSQGTTTARSHGSQCDHDS